MFALGMHCPQVPSVPMGDHTSLSGMIEQRDSKPLLDIIQDLGGWPVVMDNWNESNGETWTPML